MTAGTTVVLSQRQRIIRRFKDAGATAPQRAIDPATHHIRQSLIFNQLVQDKVLVKIEAHHFYLDEARAEDNRGQRMQTIVLVFIVLAIAIAVYLFIQWFGV